MVDQPSHSVHFSIRFLFSRPQSIASRPSSPLHSPIHACCLSALVVNALAPRYPSICVPDTHSCQPATSRIKKRGHWHRPPLLSPISLCLSSSVQCLPRTFFHSSAQTLPLPLCPPQLSVFHSSDALSSNLERTCLRHCCAPPLARPSLSRERFRGGGCTVTRQ